MYRIIQLNIRIGICHASVRYARTHNKLINSLYDPRRATFYIMEVDANNLYGWGMSQEMLDGDFEWMSDDEYRIIELLLNYAEGRTVIFDTRLFDHKENEKENKVLFSRWTWNTRLSYTIETMIIHLLRW